jgi:hypothetical protein
MFVKVFIVKLHKIIETAILESRFSPTCSLLFIKKGVSPLLTKIFFMLYCLRDGRGKERIPLSPAFHGCKNGTLAFQKGQTHIRANPYKISPK